MNKFIWDKAEGINLSIRKNRETIKKLEIDWKTV